MKLAGRYAVITGASEGLGAQIAARFVAEGASVTICARSRDKLELVEARLKTACVKGQQVLAVRADVSNTADVMMLTRAALSTFPHVDILVNNAGIYGPMGRIEDIDWQSWVDAIHVNLMGTVYPCREFMPHFRARRYGKIINLSGGGATNPMPRVSAYAAAKAAVVRFTESLALEARDDHVDVNSVAPGALATQMMDQLMAAGPDVVGHEFYARMEQIRDSGGTPLETGAQLCVYLASEESDGVSGKLISAVWDPWRDFANHLKTLQGTDIYTLRRIVPKDRGQDWGG